MFFVFMVLGVLVAMAITRLAIATDSRRRHLVLTIVAGIVLLLSALGLLCQAIWAPNASGLGILLESLAGAGAGFFVWHLNLLDNFVSINVVRDKQEEVVEEKDNEEEDEVQAEIDAFQEEIDDLQEEIDGLEEEKDEHKSSIEELEQEIADARTEIADIEAAIKERRDAIEDRRRRIEELERQRTQAGTNTAAPAGEREQVPAEQPAQPAEAQASASTNNVPAADGQPEAGTHGHEPTHLADSAVPTESVPQAEPRPDAGTQKPEPETRALTLASSEPPGNKAGNCDASIATTGEARNDTAVGALERK